MKMKPLANPLTKTSKTNTEKIIFVSGILFHQPPYLQEKNPLDSRFHCFEHHLNELCRNADIAFAYRSEPSINIFLEFPKTHLQFDIFGELMPYFWT